jgi:hypothetical protein
MTGAPWRWRFTEPDAGISSEIVSEVIMGSGSALADEAENHGADEEEGSGDSDIVHEKLSLCAACSAIADSPKRTKA